MHTSSFIRLRSFVSSDTWIVERWRPSRSSLTSGDNLSKHNIPTAVFCVSLRSWVMLFTCWSISSALSVLFFSVKECWHEHVWLFPPFDSGFESNLSIPFCFVLAEISLLDIRYLFVSSNYLRPFSVTVTINIKSNLII